MIVEEVHVHVHIMVERERAEIESEKVTRKSHFGGHSRPNYVILSYYSN